MFNDFTEKISSMSDKLSTNLVICMKMLSQNGNELFYYTFANPISNIIMNRFFCLPEK